MFMLQRLSLLLCLLPLTLIPSQAAQAATPSKFTQDQVGQIASKFLQQIRQLSAQKLAPSASEAGRLEVGQSSSGTSGSSGETGRMRWHVTIPDPIHPQDIEVEDATGRVVYYMRHDNRPSHQPLDTPISKDQAVAKATSALEAAGVLKTKELTFKEAFLDRGSADSSFWFVSWSRVHNGMPYREQDANVTVDSQTGDVTGFSVNFHTPPPDSSVFNISRDQAEGIAARQMVIAGFQISQPPRVQAEVIQPNSFWQPGGSEANRQPYARVAWTCHYTEGSRSYEVWVDAATGGVIGGQVIGRRGRIRLPVPKIPSKH